MLKIKKLIEELPVTPMEKQVIEQMLSDSYANMCRKCQVLPDEWKTALDSLFKDIKEG